MSENLLNTPQKFNITNELLRACMGHTSDWLYKYDGCTEHFRGFCYSKRSAGYVVLCTLLHEALNIYRYPFTSDRMLASRVQIRELQGVINHVPLHVWNEAIVELQQLYEHVQNVLNQHFNDESPLILKRSIGQDYAYNLYRMVIASKLLNKTHITIEMDILNSYLNQNDFGYQNTVCLEHKVSPSDVLYAHELITNGDTEPGEWVVINRNKKGLVSIPIESITFNNNFNLKIEQIQSFKSEAEAAEFLMEHGSPYIRFSENLKKIDDISSPSSFLLDSKQTIPNKIRQAFEKYIKF